jgi:uncharacterized protein with von Willebrand factor type A (vWA) domain
VADAVVTLELDLPPLVGALSRRLRNAGIPMTPERPVELARALTLVRPITRRRLYWTARAVFVSDRAQVKAFDAVFASIFGPAAADETPPPDDARMVAAAPDERPASERAGSPREPARRDPRVSPASSPPRAGEEDEDAAEVDVPLAMASDEEQLAGKRFDALDAHELAQLYRLMSRLELATPLRRTRRHERGRRGQRADLRRTLRASLRTAGEPIRLARRRRRVARRRLVMLCDISGSMEPYARAYLQFLTSAAGSGPNAEAFVFATRLTRLARAGLPPSGARDPARRRHRAGLVQRHAHRRRAQDVQRSPRASGHGAGRGGRDPLRRLGARRPDARGSRDGPPGAPRPPDRVGQPARQRERLLRAGRRHGRRAAALRRARERPQLRGARRGRRRDRGAVDGPAGRAARGRGLHGGAVAQRHAGAGQLGSDAQRLRPEQGQHDPGMVSG